MAQEIDWINSQAEMCNINSYNSDRQKGNRERKMICFVDVAKLNEKDRNLDTNVVSDQPDNITDSAGELDLRNLEEEEVIIIKDKEPSNCLNTEGAVCLFKKGSLKDVNIVSWLSNDLQKYSFGFQHALTPLRTCPKIMVFDKGSQNNNNTGLNSSATESGNSEDLAYYANKLCSLVIEMTRKELKDKWENASRCICQNITSYRQGNRFSGTENKSSSDNDFKPQEGPYSESGRREDDNTSVNKGMMVYANQMASDMMLSFLKTMKVQKGRHSAPACAVLKDVLVRHAKEIISDLIDSSMKNLHNITGALMTDSDFIYGLKKNAYNVGSQKSTEILEAIVRRLFRVLSGDDKNRAQSLAFTTYKLGSMGNQRTQAMQFASLKRESHSQGKERGTGLGKNYPSGSRGPDKQGSLDVYAKELLLTALMQIQQHLLEKTRSAKLRETNANSFGYTHHDAPYDRTGERSPKRSSKHCDGRSDSDSFKDKGGLLLSVIQKILQEVGFNSDDSCTDKFRG